MDGGDGNDTYIVDNIGDKVGETYDDALGGTSDTVVASVSYTLGSGTTSKSNGFGIENLNLSGSANINATGNGKNNILTGNSGANILNGGIGADTMVGGDGNDTYIVDNVGDVVTENFDDALGGTKDTVKASISYTLGFGLENLTLTGSAIINGTGNAKNNLITGNNGANVLSGGSGNDTLKGGSGNDTLTDTIGVAGNDLLDGGTGADNMNGGDGNDTYIVDNVGDVAAETFNDALGGVDTVQASVSHTLGFGIENLTLTGSANINGTGNGNNNIIKGNNGANALNGGIGVDTLTGGGGADTFVLDARGAFNADVITDFSTAVDKIGLANALDNGLSGVISPGIQQLLFNSGNTPGSVLNSAWFFKGAGLTGNGGGDLSGIFADTTTGNIFYNPTTNIFGDSALIATINLSAMATLTNNNFIYVA